jgi:uncharacterized protein YecE (DUF72 family)
MTHTIRIGVGGWTFEPWRGPFYPANLPQKQELSYASRALTSIEINGTYYSRFKPESWRKWHDETPDDFVFAVKASRYCTNRKILSEAGDSIASFLSQGLTGMGDKLGPINWQFMATKKFDPQDFAGFLALLPKEKDAVPLRHVLEVRHPSFQTQEFYDLARTHGVAIAYAEDEDFPQIDEPTANFTYVRLMSSREDLDAGVTSAELKRYASKLKAWSKRGDVFAYFISGAKVRNPAAAQALIASLK